MNDLLRDAIVNLQTCFSGSENTQELLLRVKTIYSYTNYINYVYKLYIVKPIPKEKPVRDVNRHLRPISLTPSLSKLAEEFVVEEFFAPAILGIVDPAQFGGIPRSSLKADFQSSHEAPRSSLRVLTSN